MPAISISPARGTPLTGLDSCLDAVQTENMPVTLIVTKRVPQVLKLPALCRSHAFNGLQTDRTLSCWLLY